jgi:hypothetical protein
MFANWQTLSKLLTLWPAMLTSSLRDCGSAIYGLLEKNLLPCRFIPPFLALFPILLLPPPPLHSLALPSLALTSLALPFLVLPPLFRRALSLVLLSY